jgi:hypothetical protein
MSIISSDIGNIRLASQQLSGTKIKSASDMVAWFGAIQGQEYALTKWSLGLRLTHLTDPDIENELTDGRILRTHLLRPTWHFVSSADIRWLVNLTAPRVKAVNAYMHRQLELDTVTFNKCSNILVKILQGGNQLTRVEINNEFRKNRITATGHRLSYIMMNSELDGLICSGGKRGNQFTYALLEERAKTTSGYSKEEALAELAKRYFISRGPSTIKDFAIWSGLTVADCKKGAESAKSNLRSEIIDGDQYYLSNDVTFNIMNSAVVYLLPVYDEFIMGYRNRDAIFEYKNTLKNITKIQFNSMVVSDGQVIGTWRRSSEKSGMKIEFDFFEKLNKTQEKGVETAVKQFEKYSGITVHYLG